ncbi:MAG: circadian clock protein KaiC [Euryarchaeota archaeon]|nr:circadian clock protein KaiC [Euryarchaeota archaeon]MCG2737723.1 circadian clock protein KaiC [Candidatus Methanoperedenaceae archaeon]
MPDIIQTTNLKRVPTEIPGFDELCEGGLLRERTYLVSGISGAGKTIFGLQYLYNGITKYGDLKALEDEGKLAMIDARHIKSGGSSNKRPVDVESFDMRSVLDRILELQEKIAAKRVFVSGAASIGLSIDEPSNIRVEFLKLSKTLETVGLTSLITCETIDDSTESRFGVETFVTEGTILMAHKRIDRVRVRSIEIINMKGSNHSNTIHPYEITSSGIVVHPNDEVYSFTKKQG